MILHNEFDMIEQQQEYQNGYKASKHQCFKSFRVSKQLFGKEFFHEQLKYKQVYGGLTGSWNYTTRSLNQIYNLTSVPQHTKEQFMKSIILESILEYKLS